MSAFDPQLLGVLVALMALTTAMLLLGRSRAMLEETKPERCASCGRLLDPGLRCHCSDG